MTRLQADVIGGKQQREYRRSIVAELRLKGWTEQAIADQLAERGIYITRKTVSTDLTTITRRWLQSSLIDTATYKSNLLAEIALVKRQAWAEGRLSVVLEAIDREAKLLGLFSSVEVTQQAMPTIVEFILAPQQDTVIDGTSRVIDDSTPDDETKLLTASTEQPSYEAHDI